MSGAAAVNVIWARNHPLPFFYEDEDKNFAKKLSTDKEPEKFKEGYVVYANGTRWYFENWFGWGLYWIPSGDIESAIKNTHPEFKAIWLPKRRMFKLIRWVILNHPNLKEVPAKKWWQFWK